MNDTIRDVVFVDGVRTPFGKAGKLFEETRADDMIIRCIRSLLRRNPGLPPERVDEVALAATTPQILGSSGVLRWLLQPRLPDVARRSTGRMLVRAGTGLPGRRACRLL